MSRKKKAESGAPAETGPAETMEAKLKRLAAARDFLPERPQSGNITRALLHGSDLPRGQSQLTVIAEGLRKPGEGFDSPAILDFQPVTFNGKKFGAFGVNKTNLRRLIKLAGKVPVSALIGASISFERQYVNNPKTDQPTYGLSLTKVVLVGKTKPKGAAKKQK
jgi:hypothetical protein